jgi:peptide/nickel transport system permease protein
MTDASIKAQPARSRLLAERVLRGAPVPVALAIAWLAAMALVAVLADRLKPYEISTIDLTSRLVPPGTWRHLLGTDELGRDVLSRLIVSIRSSLMIALLATILSAVIGTALGFLAAQRRGLVEHVILVLVDFQATLPFMIMALAVLAFLGSSVWLLVVLMAFYGWERYARMARGLAMSANAKGYAAAAVQLGASPVRIYLRHILPNVSATLVVSMTLTFPEVILAESGLSFLGLGVQLPSSSLGNMVGFGRDYLASAPWIMLAPAAVITLTSLAVSTLGDWLRDRLDPALR